MTPCGFLLRLAEPNTSSIANAVAQVVYGLTVSLRVCPEYKNRPGIIERHPAMPASAVFQGSRPHCHNMIMHIFLNMQTWQLVCPSAFVKTRLPAYCLCRFFVWLQRLLVLHRGFEVVDLQNFVNFWRYRILIKSCCTFPPHFKHLGPTQRMQRR